jgi:hypothetical protein
MQQCPVGVGTWRFGRNAWCMCKLCEKPAPDVAPIIWSLFSFFPPPYLCVCVCVVGSGGQKHDSPRSARFSSAKTKNERWI